MNTEFKVDCFLVKNRPYYRINIPARLSKKLGIRDGDKILVDIKKVIRQEEIRL